MRMPVLKRFVSVASRHTRTLGSLWTTRWMSTSSSDSVLQLEKPSEFVTHVKLNRPEKLNALSNELWRAIGEVFNELSEDPSCRVIVLSGNGKAFCAGIDLSSVFKLAQIARNDDLDVARKAKELRKLVSHYQRDLSSLQQCPKPVISVIQGACVGAGMALVTASDVRLCSKDAWFQVKEVDIGLAADVGTLQRLPKLIGSDSLVRDLCFTVRKLESEEALQRGFVSSVHNDQPSALSEAMAMAKVIATKSPVAVQGTKVHLNYARDHSVQDSLDFIAHYNSAMLQSNDLLKAGEAAVSRSKEAANFEEL